MTGGDMIQAKTARWLKPQRASEAVAASFAQANELLMNTMRAIYQTQAEAVRDQAADMAKIWRPMESDDRPADVFMGVFEEVFKGTERLFASTQKTGDLMCDLGWQLSSLCVNNAEQLAAQLQSGLLKAYGKHT